MKRKNCVSLTIASLLIFAAWGIADETADKAAVTKAVKDYYFMGLEKSDPELLGKIFYKESHLMGIFNSKLWDKASVEWRKGFDPAKAKPGGWDRKVVSVDIAGEVAAVKTVLTSEKTTYIDFLNLMKIDGKWMIVNKIFHTIRK